MKIILTGTLAAFVLGAAIASSQTQPPSGAHPPGTQPPGASQPSGDKPQQGGDTREGDQPVTASPSNSQRDTASTTTYRGYLRGSAASGWTISPIEDRATGTSGAAAGGATAGTAGTTAGGAGATAGAAGTAGRTTTYTVVAPSGSKVDLASLGDQCVEIVGSLAPATGSGGASASGAAGTTGQSGAAAGNTPRSTTGNTSGSNMSSQSNRTLNVTTIRAVQGGCTR